MRYSSYRYISILFKQKTILNGFNFTKVAKQSVDKKIKTTIINFSKYLAMSKQRTADQTPSWPCSAELMEGNKGYSLMTSVSILLLPALGEDILN